MKRKPWETNCIVRKVLLLNWVDVDILLVNTVRDTVFIKGELKFKGRLVSVDDEGAVTEKLRKVKDEVLETDGVEHLQWELDGWRAKEDKWTIVTETKN